MAVIILVVCLCKSYCRRRTPGPETNNQKIAKKMTYKQGDKISIKDPKHTVPDDTKEDIVEPKQDKKKQPPKPNSEAKPTVVPEATKVEIKKPTVRPQTVKIDIEDTDSDSYSDSYTDSDSDSEINENVEVNTEVSDSCISLEINDSDLY
jgi:hypothetical protein